MKRPYYIFSGAFVCRRRQASDAAHCLVEGASFNILKNLRYYGAPSRGKDVSGWIGDIEHLRAQLPGAPDVETVMGLEGAMRAAYYKAWSSIFSAPWADIDHRNLKKRVIYRHLVRLEFYKLQRHFLDIEPYDPFKIWW